MSRYRWALRPAWILSHVFVLACVVGFVAAGFWQVRRLGEVRAENATEAARQHQPVVPATELLRPGMPDDEVAERVLRPVTATGTYLVDEQVLIRNQSQNGSPGYHVVAPLLLDDGTAVVVNRGWVPLLTGEREPGQFAAPTGTVTVTGLVAGTQRHSGVGVTDPAEGELENLARVDVERLQQQVEPRLLSAYVVLQHQEPPVGALPVPLPEPTQDEGNHLNYAGQWFIFATLTCVVYPLLLRRTARNKEIEARTAEGPGDDAGGDGGGEPPRGPSPDRGPVAVGAGEPA